MASEYEGYRCRVNAAEGRRWRANANMKAIAVAINVGRRPIGSCERILKAIAVGINAAEGRRSDCEEI